MTDRETRWEWVRCYCSCSSFAPFCRGDGLNDNDRFPSLVNVLETTKIMYLFVSVDVKGCPPRGTRIKVTTPKIFI